MAEVTENMPSPEITNLFAPKRKGNTNKCTGFACFLFVYVVFTALLVSDFFVFEALEVSDKIEDVKAVLSACNSFAPVETGAFEFYETFFGLSERICVTSLFAVLLMRMKRIWLGGKDAMIGRFFFDWSKTRYVAALTGLLENVLILVYLLNLLSFLIPVFGDGLEVQVISRDGLQSAINQEAARGVCDTLIVYGDDIFRLSFLVLFLCPVLFVSRKLMKREGEASFTFIIGKYAYSVFLLAMVVELCRLDPVALTFLLPPFLVFGLESLICNYCLKHDALVKSYKISERYMLLFWSGHTVETFDTKTGHQKFDSISRLYRLRIHQYQMQLPYDLMVDLSPEYGSRSLMSFNNAGNMFSLGMHETIVDDKDPESNLPFSRSRLLEIDDGVLKLNKDFMARSRARQRETRDRNVKLMFQKTGAGASSVNMITRAPSTQRVSNRRSRNKAGGRVQSTLVEIDLTNADEDQEDQFVTGTRDDDIPDLDPELIINDITEIQGFDRAVLMKLEPIWDENGQNTSRINQTFDNIATIEQLNEFTNPIRTTFYGNYGAGELDYILKNEKDIICVGSGGGAMFLLDTMRYIVHHDVTQCRVHCIFTTSDFPLLQWFVEAVDDIYYASHRELSNVKIIAALTEGESSMHNVGRLQESAAFGLGYNKSYAAQPGSDADLEEPAEQDKGFSLNKGAKRILDKLQQRDHGPPVNQARIAANRVSRSSVPKLSSIRFRWGKVFLGRISIQEKFDRLKNLNFQCTVMYQGGSKELESSIRRSCKRVGFRYKGLNSYEAVQSMSPETPPMMRFVNAMESVAQVGSYALGNTRGVSHVSQFSTNSEARLLRTSRVRSSNKRNTTL